MQLTAKQKKLINYRLEVSDEMIWVLMDDLRYYNDNDVCCKMISDRAPTLINKLVSNTKLDEIELRMVKDIYYYGYQYFYTLIHSESSELEQKLFRGWKQSHNALQIKLERFLTNNNIDFVDWNEAPDYDVHGLSAFKVIDGGKRGR